MKKIIKIRLGLISAIVAFTFGTHAIAADQVVIKFSHVVATDTPKGKGAEKFKQLAEQYTQGAVKVEVYPNSTLYKDKEEIEALQMGAVQMLAPSLAKFGPLGVSAFEAFDLPFIFDNYEDLHKVTYGPVGKKILSLLEPKGIIGLGYWDNGFKSFSANNPINTPADLRGKKMRIQSSKVLDKQMRTLKAIPQVMAFSEVYQALQTGVVDGTENPISNLYTQKMHEVQKHLALTNHGYLGYAVITNNVNNHYWKTFGNAFLMGGVITTITISQNKGGDNSNNQRASDALSEALGQQLGQVATQMIQKNMNVAPTIDIRPGYRFNIMVSKDLVLPSAYATY